MATKKKEVEQPKVEAKKAPAKLVVIAKQIGKNLNVQIGEEKFTLMGSKEELEVVKEAIKAYDAKPTKSNLEAMMKSLKPETTKKAVKEEQLKAEVKATKKAVKETPKTKKTNVKDVVAEIDDKLMSDRELAQMEAAIQRQKAKREPVVQKAPERPRGSEHSRY